MDVGHSILCHEPPSVSARLVTFLSPKRIKNHILQVFLMSCLCLTVKEGGDWTV